MKYLLDGQESERLFFRKINKSDFTIWLEFHKSLAAQQHWFSEKEDEETECNKWYDRQFYRYENNLGGMNALVDKQTNNLIGHCGLLVQTVDDILELEIGYSLLPDYWSKGYASEAAKKCMDYAFENNLADSLISIISITNFPSENVALKIGMVKEKATIYNANSVNIYRITK